MTPCNHLPQKLNLVINRQPKEIGLTEQDFKEGLKLPWVTKTFSKKTNLFRNKYQTQKATL